MLKMIRPTVLRFRAAALGITSESSRLTARCVPHVPAFARRRESGRRWYQHSTEKNVLCSDHPNAEIPDCPLTEYVWKHMDNWPDKTAVICGITGRGYTYSQTHRMSIAFGANLKNKLKLEDGDTVAMMLSNSPDFVLAMMGSLQAGCVLTTINPIYSADKIARQLIDCGAKLLVTNHSLYAEVKKAIGTIKSSIPIMLANCTQETIPGDTICLADFIEVLNEDIDCLRHVKHKKDDTVFLPYSSGNAGIELTHRNIIANCVQQEAENLTLVQDTTANHQDVALCTLPFTDIYGLTATCISKLHRGVKLVTLPHFLPGTFLKAQEKYKGNILFSVPEIVSFLSTHESVNKSHFDSIRSIAMNNASMKVSEVDRLFKKAENQNIYLAQSFGTIESSSLIFMRERDNTNFESVGNLVPNTEAKVVDSNNEINVLGPNQPGELWIRGPQLMKGYHKNDTANEVIFRGQGWMKTGIKARYDSKEQFYITEGSKN